MNREDLLELKATLEKKLAAVNVLLDEESESQPKRSRPEGVHKQSSSKPALTGKDYLNGESRTIYAVFEESIKTLNEPFVRPQLIDHVRGLNPDFEFGDKTVHSVIYKLIDNEKVVTLRNGKGNQPSVYVRKELAKDYQQNEFPVENDNESADA